MARWVTVYLPGEPRPGWPRADRAGARPGGEAQHLQRHPVFRRDPVEPPSSIRLLPYPATIAIRQQGDQLVLPLLGPECRAVLDRPQQPRDGGQQLQGLEPARAARRSSAKFGSSPRNQRAVLDRRREDDLRAVHQQVREELMSQFPKKPLSAMGIFRSGQEITMTRRLPADTVITRPRKRRR